MRTVMLFNYNKLQGLPAEYGESLKLLRFDPDYGERDKDNGRRMALACVGKCIEDYAAQAEACGYRTFCCKLPIKKAPDGERPCVRSSFELCCVLMLGGFVL